MFISTVASLKYAWPQGNRTYDRLLIPSIVGLIPAVSRHIFSSLSVVGINSEKHYKQLRATLLTGSSDRRGCASTFQYCSSKDRNGVRRGKL